MPQFFDANGNPLAGGKLSFQQAGGGASVDVFTDPDLSIAFSQPIELDAAGMPSGAIFLQPGIAMLVTLVDSSDVPVANYPSDFYSPAAVSV